MRYLTTILLTFFLASCATVSPEARVGMAILHDAIHVALGTPSHSGQEFPPLPSFNLGGGGGKQVVRKSALKPKSDLLGDYVNVRAEVGGMWRNYYGSYFWTKGENWQGDTSTQVFWSDAKKLWLIAEVGKSPLVTAYNPATDQWGWVSNIHDPSARFQLHKKPEPKANELLTFTPWASDRNSEDAVSWGTASQLGFYWRGTELRGSGDGRVWSEVEGIEIRWRDAPRGTSEFPAHFLSNEYGWREGGYFKLYRNDEVRQYIIDRSITAHKAGLAVFLDWFNDGGDWIKSIANQLSERGVVVIVNINDNYNNGNFDYAFMELWSKDISYNKAIGTAQRYLDNGVTPLLEPQGANPDELRMREWAIWNRVPYRHTILNSAKDAYGNHLPDHLRY